MAEHTLKGDHLTLWRPGIPHYYPFPKPIMHGKGSKDCGSHKISQLNKIISTVSFQIVRKTFHCLFFKTCSFLHGILPEGNFRITV